MTSITHDQSPDGLLLGAGASYELGMPLVWDLTAELRAWLTPDKLRELAAGWRTQGVNHAPEAIDRLAQSLVDGRMHYESILGNLELGFTRPGKAHQDYHGLYAFLIEIVYFLLYYRQVQNHDYIKASLRLLEGVAGLASHHEPLWVFSLNHDVMIECLGARYDLPVNCGFNEQTSFPRRNAQGDVIGTLAAELLNGETLNKSGFQFPVQRERGINLLKLHGSLDVFTTNDGNDLVRFKPAEKTLRGILDALRAGNEDLVYATPHAPGGKIKASNEIVYADADGEMQFLRRTLLSGAFKFDQRSSQILPKAILDQFRQHVGRVRHLCCIGYGLGDQHVNDALKQWLERDASRRLTIVGPGVTSCPPFLLHLADQVTPIDKITSDYLAQFALRPLTTVELGMKRLRDELRSANRRKRGFA